MGAQIVADHHDRQLTGVVSDFRLGLPEEWEVGEPDPDVLAQNYRSWATENPADAAGTTEEKYIADILAVTKLVAVTDESTAERPVELHIYARWIDTAVMLDGVIRDQTRLYQRHSLTYR